MLSQIAANRKHVDCVAVDRGLESQRSLIAHVSNLLSLISRSFPRQFAARDPAGSCSTIIIHGSGPHAEATRHRIDVNAYTHATREEPLNRDNEIGISPTMDYPTGGREYRKAVVPGTSNFRQPFRRERADSGPVSCRRRFRKVQGTKNRPSSSARTRGDMQV